MMLQIIITGKKHRTVLGVALVCGFLSSAVQADPTSANYRMRWDALDAGGGVTASANYQMAGTVLPAAVGNSGSANYLLAGGFQVVPDTDNDTWRDFIDNCSVVANPTQANGNHGLLLGEDIFGNACDADLTNDGVVNFADLAAFKSKFGSNDAQADLTGDGVVNFADLARFKALFGTNPGPSGLPTP